MCRYGYADGTYQQASGVAIESGVKDDSIGVHRCLTVEGNHVTGCKNTGITVMNADDVTLRGNIVMECSVGVDICASDHVLIEDNEMHGAQIRFCRRHQGE